MIILVIGGSGSGKSLFAEDLISKHREQNHYFATMRVWDQEGQNRVLRHQKQREGKGFIQHECPKTEDFPQNLQGGILLEDLTNLLMNHWYEDNNAVSVVAKVSAAMDTLIKTCPYFVVVCNDITRDGAVYPNETEQFLSALGELVRNIAKKADKIYEVVAGIPARCHKRIERKADSMTLIIGGKYQGKRQYAQDLAKSTDCSVVVDLNELLKTTPSFADALVQIEAKTQQNTIYVCDEVGCGVVPITQEERNWRELVGQVTTVIASRSTLVIRMICGIPNTIKGA